MPKRTRGRQPLRRFLILFALSLAVPVARAAPNDASTCNWEPSRPACKCLVAQLRGQTAATSANFRIESFVGGPDASDVGRYCEEVCARLRGDVFGMKQSARWQPTCRVVLHATRQSYFNAVAQGASQTIGTSTISLSGGRVTQRRIDLLAVNPQQGLAALPHELVHVLFVDAFPTTAPPKWAEEGLALSMDPADKRARHAHDLEVALAAGTTLPIRRILADTEYPSASHRAAFYAQSLSLVEFLTKLDSPKEFVQFVMLSTDLGHESALKTVYHLDGRELERRWQRQVAGPRLAVLDSQ